MEQELNLNYFYNLAYLERKPVSAVIELLTECNLRCKHCYIPSHTNKGMSTEKIKSLLYELHAMGEYSNAIVHAFQGFRAPFSGKIVHIFPEQSAAFN